jgi:hypothetical protein
MITTRRLLGTALALVLAGCAALPTTGDGVVELRVELPASTTLLQGESLQLIALAYDRTGAVVPAAAIVWSTPDTTLSVDPSLGVVLGIAESGTGRVQAAVGTLRSNLITFTLQAAPSGSRQ